MDSVRRGRWFVALAAAAVAVVVIGIAVRVANDDESADDESSAAPPTSVDDHDTDGTSGTTLETIPEVTLSTTSPPTEIPAPSIQLVENLDERGWDQDRGRCYALVVDWPGVPPEVAMCVTGSQIDRGVDAYVRGDGYAYTWSATRLPDGDVGALAGGGVGEDGASFLPPTEQVRCGPPAHEVPVNRWILVTHCLDGDRGSALYTLLPDSPTAPTAHLVGTADGTVVGADIVQSLDVDRHDAIGDQLDVFEVTLEPSWGTVNCVMVVPAAAERWFERCRGHDEPAWNNVLLHDGRPYVVERTNALDPPRLVALPVEATLRSNGCMSPVVEVLAAISDPTGPLGGFPTPMVSAVACDAATSAFDAPTTDRAASAIFEPVLLQNGPVDGSIAMLEPSGPGRFVVTNTGTGLDPDPWPLAVPPARLFWWAAGDDLPPVDITEQVDVEFGSAAERTDVVEAISRYLGDQYPTDGAPPHVVVDLLDLAGSPLVVAPSVRYLDDSVGSGAFFFWLVERGTTVTVERVIVVNTCTRGVTELDGVRLCV